MQFFRNILTVAAALVMLSTFSAACGKSAEDVAASFETVEKGALATDVRNLLGEPERVESSPQIPDLEHWKYNGGRLTVSLLQGRVLGKFDAGPTDPTLPVPENDANAAGNTSAGAGK
ncbi:MAG: hypothetical protein NXI24_03175 [bacterium]|nr:hypothetical protein [bacterium]